MDFLWLSRGNLPLLLKNSCYAFKELRKNEAQNIKSSILVFDKSFKEVWHENLASAVKVFFCHNKSQDQGLIEAVNGLKVFSVIDEASSENEVDFILKKALNHYEEKSAQKLFLEGLKLENEKLVQKKSKKEKEYHKYTLNFKHINSETQKALRKRKDIVHLAKKLSGITVIDDFFKVLQQEIKIFHKVHSLYLVYTDHNKQSFLLFSKERFIKEKPLGRVDRLLQAFNHSHKLANLIKRPVLPIKQFVLLKNPPCTLIFEATLNVEEEKVFSSFLEKRQKILELTFELALFQNQMRKTMQTWEKVFNGIQNPLAVIKRDGSVIRANKHFFQMNLSRKCYQTLQNQNKIRVNSFLENHLFEEKTQRTPIVVKDKIYELHSFPIKFSYEKKTSAVINYYIDVTKAKKLYSQMIQNEKAMALGHLAQQLTHELNNPLTGIKSMAQILSSKASSAVKEDLNYIQEGVNQCLSIIQNLHDFSCEALDLKVVSLRFLVEKTLPLLKSAVSFFERETTLDQKQDFVKIQPQLIQQVIFNLVKNASQAMEKHKGKIEIRTKVLKNTVRFSVKDTGSGIDDKLKKAIYEPFFTTKSSSDGTGLGLHLCKTIIEKMGGELDFQTSLSKGSLFYFDLPRIERHSL